MQDNIKWEYMSNPPYGRRWTWYENDLVLIDAALGQSDREAAKEEALNDLRNRALGRPVGLPTVAA